MEGYDGMVILKTPLTIKSGGSKLVGTVYGWLYQKSERLQDEDFIKKVVAYNAYLLAIKKFQGSISDDGMIWTDTDGSWFSVKDFMFQIKVYSENKQEARQYQMVESDIPFVALNETEVDDHLILSEDFINRYYPQYKQFREGGVL